MTDAISIAVSGLVAQKQRLNASASNIANLTTSGAVPSETVSSTVYRPIRANLTPLVVDGQGAGVTSNITEINNPYSLSYDPSSPFANAEGLIAVPNVDIAAEFVNIIETKNAFKANIAVLRVQDDLLGDLLDTFA